MMEKLAKKLLDKLLQDAERITAGRRVRAVALTESHLEAYRTTRSLSEKEAFESVMRAARARGAIAITWDNKRSIEDSSSDFILRVDLVDARTLAEVVGRPLATDLIAEAASRLSTWFDGHPILLELLRQWEQLRTVRGYGPADVQDWIDAANAVATVPNYRPDETACIPLREASYRLFRDSKRLEKLAPAVDVLLTGDLEAEARRPDEVWKEMGLFREEQPVRMAGRIVVARQRVKGLLDAPYAAFPPSSIVGVVGAPRHVMTIENQTTFHSEARRMAETEVLLIYTGGMPSPAWRTMYQRILSGLPDTVPIYHWGDVDEGGFRIAALLSRDAEGAGRTLLPWRMHPDDIPHDLRRATTQSVANRMQRYAAAAGWDDLARSVSEAKMTVEQEGLD
jgi:hypothetical protein